MKNGAQFQEAIRHLLCMGESNFIDAFGREEMGNGETVGAYLFKKFRVEYEGNVGKFLCYLDNRNMAALFRYLKTYLSELGEK